MKIFFLVICFIIQSYGQSGLILLMDDAEDVYAVDLNGSNEFATNTSPTGVDLSAKEYSIIAWVKTPTPIDGAAKRGIISTDANPTRGWFLHLSENELWSLWVNAGTGAASYISSAETRAGTWTLIVVTCDDVGANSDYHWYKDGVAVSGTNVTNYTNTVSGSTKLTVGMDGYPQNFRWNSLIGQVQVVSGHALTPTEVASLYNKGGVLNSSYASGTVVCWYKWSGKTDAVFLQDYSASGNNLTGTNVTQADDQVIYPAGYP